MARKASPKCIALIKDIEKFRSHPYLPTPKDRPTIGYGSTTYPDGRKVTLEDPPITEEQALAILLANLVKYEDCVNKCVTYPINQNQFDALVDFTYNLGTHSLEMSTLLKLLNAGDVHGASEQFPKWIYQSGTVLQGLVIRRERERALFLS